MLASGRALGFSAGWPGVLRRGLIVVYSSASDVKSFHVCFRYGIVLAEFIRSFLSFFYLHAEVVFLFAMGSRATNNSLQTAPIMSTPLTGKDDVANALSTSPAGGSLFLPRWPLHRLFRVFQAHRLLHQRRVHV